MNGARGKARARRRVFTPGVCLITLVLCAAGGAQAAQEGRDGAMPALTRAGPAKFSRGASPPPVARARPVVGVAPTPVANAQAVPRASSRSAASTAAAARVSVTPVANVAAVTRVSPRPVASTAAGAAPTPEASPPVATAASPTPFPREALEIGGSTILPGTRRRLVLTVSESFFGGSVRTPLVVLHGDVPGPVICLAAGVHGDELNGTEIVRRVLAQLSPPEIEGTVIGIPIVNVHGFRSRSRYLPDRRDLNRHFPGRRWGSSASRIAHEIFEGVVRHCDALVDFHSGSFHRSNLPQVRGDFRSREIIELARALGLGVAIHHPGAEGTLRRAATDAGIPTVLFESGDAFRIQSDEIQRGVDAVLHLLREAGMLRLPIPTGAPEEPRFYFDSTWVRVDHGGIFLPAVGLGDSVVDGDVLGTVFDPLGGERAVLRSPVGGTIIGMALPQVVLPGFAAFHVGAEGARRPQGMDKTVFAELRALSGDTPDGKPDAAEGAPRAEAPSGDGRDEDDGVTEDTE